VKIKFLIPLILILLILPGCVGTNLVPISLPTPSTSSSSPLASSIKLPAPNVKGPISLEESLQNRRSIREYTTKPLKIEEVSQLLWAAQGITSDSGGRTAPSAGALYPLKVYLVAGNVENLPAGIYEYSPQQHELISLVNGDMREKLSNAAVEQASVKKAAIDIVISSIYERTTLKYGNRGIQYAQMETGHAAQNICLQATALDLGAVTVGAFYDNQVKAVFGMPANESPLYIIPVGKKN
jgi:SagB-type dehydrogenase family enzyme